MHARRCQLRDRRLPVGRGAGWMSSACPPDVPTVVWLLIELFGEGTAQAVGRSVFVAAIASRLNSTPAIRAAKRVGVRVVSVNHPTIVFQEDLNSALSAGMSCDLFGN